MKLTRWFLPVLLALLGIFAIATPAFATEPQPTALEIQEISAYENTREDGDQLYLVQYYIAINSTYNANQLFIFRLFDEDDNELTHTTPYPYYNQGYGMGVVAFYLDADEAPDWASGVYVKLVGNPLISWNGTTPSTTMAIIDWNTGSQADMQEAVSGKILGLASELTVYWGTAMTTVVQGVTVLTDYGANYFLQVVPYLGTVAPYVVGQYTFTPDYPIDEKPPADNYADSLVDAISGTVFDISPTARSWGMDRGMLTALIWYSAAVGLVVALIMKKGLKKGAMLIIWPFVVAGAFFGVPLMVTIMAGFLMLISTVWVFYKGAT